MGGAPGPPWAAAARLQGGFGGSEVVAAAFNRATSRAPALLSQPLSLGARWLPCSRCLPRLPATGLISGSLFPAPPFPPLPSNRSRRGGFPRGWHPAGGGGSVLPAHLNLARFLSNSCFSRWKSWMYFIWGQQRQRGLSARGRGTQTPKAPLPPMGTGGSPALGPSLQLWIPSPVSCLHPLGSPRRAPAMGERAPRTFFCCW